ncbi:hypothetical protein PTSG_11289 [Salpingoeca rosetta]|uniref:Uncharacterized protein n=1 Tax=Salpingoeca rosetta (strain ATCC 50818 / BSB-021) TaxID=946362 RepID=F2USZ5_SALR5|nr:uncharacterized protein PTSG_11289 [Salpingoeca rosetta]EGD81254.1 hypothetical protein PTSG_11289 [Salpingoeca rosetta]|eukprot:XP_004987650.1 hypothetical protein PTSG_11289 [Salpingoeca rosetta]
MVLSRLSLRRLAPVSVSAAHAARARAAAHQGVVRIAGAQSTVRFASTGDKKQGDDEDAAQHAAKAAKDKKEESQKPQEEQQQQQQQQASSLASGAGSEAKEQKEELRGPIRKLVDLFHHLKSQVTEDNVHYDRSKPYQAPVDRRRSSIERPAKAIEENKSHAGNRSGRTSRTQTPL